MAKVKVKCPYCGSEDIVRYGKNSTWRQRYLSLSIKTMSADLVQKKKIIRMAMNGAGVRGTG